jgi:hypothetical protein
MIPYWPDAAEDMEKPAYEREYGQIWCEKPKIVVSTTIKEAGWNTRVISADVFDEVARLKRETKGYILYVRVGAKSADWCLPNSCHNNRM